MLATRVCLLLSGVAALTACSGASDPELAIMQESSTESPDWASGSDSLPTDDLTHVDDVDHLSVYASRNGDDDWCVVLAAVPTSAESGPMVGASCAPPERFATAGVRVQVAGSEAGYSSALLLPDEFGGEIGDDWERVDDNLAVRS